jgi:hypothetical protein
MYARNTLPAEVACIGVRCPTQFTVVTMEDPITWSILTTLRPSWTATLTVSPTVSARSWQIGRLMRERSCFLVAPAASCTTP